MRRHVVTVVALLVGIALGSTIDSLFRSSPPVQVKLTQQVSDLYRDSLRMCLDMSQNLLDRVQTCNQVKMATVKECRQAWTKKELCK